jgi:HEPN domain-containing protein
MPPDAKHETVGHWLALAKEELRIANELGRLAEPSFHGACFHAQQSAEKAIKAALIACDVAFPFIHDLVRLAELLPGQLRAKIKAAPISKLTPWAVDARYFEIGFTVTAEDAKLAIGTAQQVLEHCAGFLNDQGYGAR